MLEDDSRDITGDGVEAVDADAVAKEVVQVWQQCRSTRQITVATTLAAFITVA